MDPQYCVSYLIMNSILHDRGFYRTRRARANLEMSLIPGEMGVSAVAGAVLGVFATKCHPSRDTSGKYSVPWYCKSAVDIEFRVFNTSPHRSSSVLACLLACLPGSNWTAWGC